MHSTDAADNDNDSGIGDDDQPHDGHLSWPTYYGVASYKC